MNRKRVIIEFDVDLDEYTAPGEPSPEPFALVLAMLNEDADPPTTVAMTINGETRTLNFTRR